MTPESRRVASAVAGEAGALGDLAHADTEGGVGRAHRASGALYLGATAQGTSGPALSAWRRDMSVMSARRLVLAQAVERCGEVLSAAGAASTPF